MLLFLPRLGAAILGNRHAEAPADPERDPAARVFSSVTDVPVSRGPGSTPRSICLVALICALSLWKATIAGNVKPREEAPPPDGPARVATAVRPISSCPVARPVRIRPHRGMNVALHFPRLRSDDPNDDETSDDPNDDDDNWDDLTADDDTDVPVISWLSEMVRYRIDLEAGHALASTQSPSSPFPTLQRLRC